MNVSRLLDLPVIATFPGELSLRWVSEIIVGEAADGSDWQPRVLEQSAERPGHYLIVNCACGSPWDAGVEGGIHVRHPGPERIVWELDVACLRGLFRGKPGWGDAGGVVQLDFSRAAYEDTVRRFVRAMQQCAAQPLRIADLDHCHTYRLDAFRRAFPEVDALPIATWNPSVHGDELNELLAMDADARFGHPATVPAFTFIVRAHAAAPALDFDQAHDASFDESAASWMPRVWLTREYQALHDLARETQPGDREAVSILVSRANRFCAAFEVALNEGRPLHDARVQLRVELDAVA